MFRRFLNLHTEQESGFAAVAFDTGLKLFDTLVNEVGFSYD